MGADETPLCVDLDGTLIAGDTLVISLRHIATRTPWQIPRIAIALLRGRAAFKRSVAATVIPNPAKLPWRATVVAFVREQRASGRRVLLATAADRRVADSVATYLGCFDGIVASDGAENAKGSHKVEAIRRAIGEDTPFDYMGDSTADLPVFEVARVGYLVAPNHTLREQALRIGRIQRIFEER
ncbi:MAG: haloacid dehalogenase-like hydrolase [Gemmatimonadaceae bacterium]